MTLQPIALEQSSTIVDLRQAIEKVTGLSTSAYEISSHRSARHLDTWPVFEDDIATDTFRPPEFTLVYSPYRDGKQPKGAMRVHVTPKGSGKTVTILCQPNYTFDELGTRIEQELSSFPRASQRLFVGNRRLEHEKSRRYTLSSLRLVDVSYSSIIPFIVDVGPSVLTFGVIGSRNTLGTSFPGRLCQVSYRQNVRY